LPLLPLHGLPLPFAHGSPGGTLPLLSALVGSAPEASTIVSPSTRARSAAPSEPAATSNSATLALAPCPTAAIGERVAAMSNVPSSATSCDGEDCAISWPGADASARASVPVRRPGGEPAPLAADALPVRLAPAVGGDALEPAAGPGAPALPNAFPWVAAGDADEP
jgi:hypothetical protein